MTFYANLYIQLEILYDCMGGACTNFGQHTMHSTVVAMAGSRGGWKASHVHLLLFDVTSISLRRILNYVIIMQGIWPKERFITQQPWLAHYFTLKKTC